MELFLHRAITDKKRLCGYSHPRALLLPVFIFLLQQWCLSSDCFEHYFQVSLQAAESLDMVYLLTPLLHFKNTYIFLPSRICCHQSDLQKRLLKLAKVCHRLPYCSETAT